MKRFIKNRLESAYAFAAAHARSQDSAYRLAERAYRYSDRNLPIRSITTRFGKRLKLDLRQWQDRIMAYGAYEPNLARIMRRYLKKGDHFTDVGANIGYTALLAESIVGPTGRVDAFEPDPQTYQRLEGHISSNRSQIVAHQLAVGASSDSIQLNRYGAASGLTSRHIRPKDVGDPTEFYAAQIRLDAISEVSQTRFIKLDCEGSEADAIEGAGRILSKDTPPIVCFEYSCEWREYGCLGLDDLCNRILEFQPRFSFFDMDGRHEKLSEAAIGELSNRQVVNIYAIAD